VRWIEWSTRVVEEEGLFYAAGRDVTDARLAADEQAALQRVATLVAQETAPDVLLEAVSREAGEVLDVDATHLGRYEDDGTVVSVAQWGRYPSVPVGTRFPLDGDSVSARVLRTGRCARMDGYDDVGGAIAAALRELGIRFAIGAPIVVGGRTWGVMTATAKDRPFPPETELRLERFSDLAGTAIANASAHGEVRALAEEQAALRRVATLVAEQAAQERVFAAIAEELGRLLGVDSVVMVQFDDGAATVVADWGTLAPVLPIGTRAPLEGRNVASAVFHTGRAARLDDDDPAPQAIALQLDAGRVRSAVATPITVEGHLWGATLAVSTGDARLPANTETRIGQFTQLMATAIANAEARREVARLAEEQAALRRVATLVAQGAAASAVFDAVIAEVADLLDASAVTLARYVDDDLVVLATRGVSLVKRGERFPMGGTNVTSRVLRTGRPARLDDYSGATGSIGEHARGTGVRSVVAAPVVVEGSTWGVLATVWSGPRLPPDGTEDRLAGFAELLHTAIANADTRDELTASRARVLLAGDEARRRLVRDLHDGAQQRLVHTIMTLKLARRAFREGRGDPETLVDESLGSAERAIEELRELSHGILPAALHNGLRNGIDAFVARLALPVEATVLSERLPADIEASAYFIVAEALTNVVKHARASRATVRATTDAGRLTVEVCDDGVGGADPAGHGLTGIADRVDALGGQLRIDSPPGAGTTIVAAVPVRAQARSSTTFP
jgi:signal transduction histidine kinase